MRIAIITFHRAYNCGAMLQAWALKTVLERMGHSVKFLTRNELGRIPPRSPLTARARTGSLFRRIRSFVYRGLQTLMGKKIGIVAGRYYDEFRRRNLPEIDCQDKDVGNLFDAIILGSDQVLNPKLWGWNEHFLCRDIPRNVLKIAYAASAGDKRLDDESLAIVRDALNGFDAVSTREPFDEFKTVLDPTMLLEVDDYARLTWPKMSRRRRPYVYMYSCTNTDFELEVARKIARQMKLDLLITHPWGAYFRRGIPEYSDKISPDMLLDYIRNAECVIAGSFHATVLSLLHKKRFVTLRMQVDVEASRPMVFLSKLGIQDRIVNPETPISEIVRKLTKDVSQYAIQKLRDERRDSLKWLAQSLKYPES